MDEVRDLRVLVIGDRDLVTLTSTLLEDAEVAHAGTLTEAARLLVDDARWSCLLLDLGLRGGPGMTPLAGITVLSSIPGAPPVVAVTSAGAADRGSTAVSAGASDYLDRTDLVQPERLRRTLEVAVVRARRTRPPVEGDAVVGTGTPLVHLSGRLRHDLRHPLTTAIAALDTIQHMDLDEDAREGLLSMVTERLRELTRRLDDLAGALAARAEPDDPTREQLDVHDLLAEVRADLAPWDRDRLDLGVDGDGSVWGSRRLLRALLGGLVRSTLQYNPDTAVRVRVSVAVEDGQAVLLVADDGIAIAPELRDAVFDIGWTSDSPAMGVGLVAASSAATTMEGGIRAVESPHGGTAYRVELPQRPATVGAE